MAKLHKVACHVLENIANLVTMFSSYTILVVLDLIISIYRSDHGSRVLVVGSKIISYSPEGRWFRSKGGKFELAPSDKFESSTACK